MGKFEEQINCISDIYELGKEAMGALIYQRLILSPSEIKEHEDTVFAALEGLRNIAASEVRNFHKNKEN